MLIRLVCQLALSSLCLSLPLGQFGKELKKTGLDVDKIHEELKRESENVEEEFAGKETQEERARVIERDAKATRQRRQALTDVTKMWTPMGAPIIPYSYADGFPTEKKKIVTDSLKFWEERTCITFRPANETDNNFIEFNHNTTTCSSSIGMAGGKQTIDLTPECFYMGAISHELSHAFGTEHVQSRSDRDNYIFVDTDNIEENAQREYKKHDPLSGFSNYSIPYEFESLMHYGETEGAINGSRPTMYARGPYAKYQHSMKSSLATFYDILLINRMYKCTDKCKNQISCENNGVQHGSDCDLCFCPKGWTGNRCEKRPDTVNVLNLTDSKQIGMKARAVSKGFAEKLYVIEAPVDKRIKATLTWIENQKYLPCNLGLFIEIIPTKDTRINGIRICDQPKPEPIESDSNQMSVRMFNGSDDELSINMKFEIV